MWWVAGEAVRQAAFSKTQKHKRYALSGATKRAKASASFPFQLHEIRRQRALKLLLYNGTNRYIYDLKIMSLKAL